MEKTKIGIEGKRIREKCTLDVCREHEGMMCSECKKEMETWGDRFDKLIVKDYVIDVHGGLVEMYQDDLRKFIENEVSLAYERGLLDKSNKNG